MEYPEILLIIDKEQVKEIYYFIKKKKILEIRALCLNE